MQRHNHGTHFSSIHGTGLMPQSPFFLVSDGLIMNNYPAMKLSITLQPMFTIKDVS